MISLNSPEELISLNSPGELISLNSPGELISFLSEIEPKYINRLSPGFLHLYFTYHFSRKITEKSAFIPQLVHLPDKSYTIRWIPAIINQHIRNIFDCLAAACPPGVVVRGSESVPLRGEEQLNSLISLFIQQFIGETGIEKSMQYDPVYLIFAESYSHKFDTIGETEIPPSIQRWIDRFYLTRNTYSPVLEINENTDTGRFGLNVLVKNSEEPFKEAIHLNDVMTRPEYRKSKFDILRSIDLLTPSFPELEFIIKTSGRHVPTFDPNEFAEVMFRIIPMIKQYGIEVILPKALKNLVRPRISLSLSSSNPGTLTSSIT